MRRVRVGVLLMSLLVAVAGIASAEVRPDAEARIVEYIRTHVRPGQPLLVTDLYNRTFTQPDERRALDKLYKAFFRIPLFIAQYHGKFGHPPSLKVIAEQFDLRNTQAADTLLRVMESDPRVPQFLERDPRTGEITHVDTDRVTKDPKFGQSVQRQLGDWEGRPSPPFALPGFDQPAISSESLRGKTILLYIWFTGCPPCMKETPELVALRHDSRSNDLTIVGANADNLLGLGYDDSVRRRYAQGQKINFPIVEWTREADAAFGSISIFPTLFLIDTKGVITHHWVGYTSGQEIIRAIGQSPAR